MNSLKTLLSFWMSVAIAYLGAIAIFLLLLSLYWSPIWVIEVIFALLLLLSPLLIVFIAVHLMFWSYVKSQILAGLPKDFTWQAIAPEDCPLLDIDWLNQYILQLEHLGFVPLKDFQLTTESGGNPSDFARLFSHPQLNCFAEVFQSFPPNQEPIPITCTIGSLLDGDLTFATTQLKPNGVFYMLRSPKALWTYYPAATVAELLQVHLERRQQIIDSLGVGILVDLSWERYCDEERKRTIYWRLKLKRKSILIALIEATLFELKPSSEWMGDYPKFAARKRVFIRQ